MNKVMKLSKRVDETEGRLDKIDTDILGMKQEMTKKEDLNNLKLDTLKYVDKKIAEQIDEYREREMRKTNIIISNMPESKEQQVEQKIREDMRIFQEIIAEIGLRNIKAQKIIRLGESKDKPRLAKVVLSTPSERKEVLAAAKKMRETKKEELKDIFINPDLSKLAREEGKKLRAELARRKGNGETNIAIRRGKIVSVGTNDFRTPAGAEGGNT